MHTSDNTTEICSDISRHYIYDTCMVLVISDSRLSRFKTLFLHITQLNNRAHNTSGSLSSWRPVEEKEKEDYVYIKYKDRHISCTFKPQNKLTMVVKGR